MCVCVCFLEYTSKQVDKLHCSERYYLIFLYQEPVYAHRLLTLDDCDLFPYTIVICSQVFCIANRVWSVRLSLGCGLSVVASGYDQSTG